MLSRAWPLIAVLLVTACYNPNLQNGAQQCAPGNVCAAGFECGGDGRCYRAGESPPPGMDLTATVDAAEALDRAAADSLLDFAVVPDLAATDGPGCNAQSCAPPTPICDPLSGLCVGCRNDGDCASNADGGVQVPRVCCNTICIDKTSDLANCGKCGNACGNGESCCSGGCVDTARSTDHCGRCGKVCSGGKANWSCTVGQCAISGCQLPTADCNKDPVDGCEVNLQSDANHCGMCGMACKAANAAVACNNGCFIQQCDAGFANCDNDTRNGCEANIRTDAKNCGVCARSCVAPPNATPACVMGACGVGTCTGNFRDCDGNPVNGCEVNTDNDVKNCGKCGAACAIPMNGAPACVAAVCGLAPCGNPFQDCDGNPNNGCETNTSTEVAHCGGCGKKCPPIANGSAACVNSVCGVGACSATFRDCNNLVNDGCETNTESNLAHCGKCGRACPAVPNAIAACRASDCAIGQCNGAFKDCDVNPANGCEVNPLSDANHCGVCGNVCKNNGKCVNGMCQGRPAPFSNFGNVNWYKLPVVGLMTDDNVRAACLAVGLTVPCSAMGVCQYSDNLCKMQTPETMCGSPMFLLARALNCGSPGGCAPLEGVFTYMGNKWQGACGTLNGLWCATGNSTSDKLALCVDP